jgi:hypothetical protein
MKENEEKKTWLLRVIIKPNLHHTNMTHETLSPTEQATYTLMTLHSSVKQSDISPLSCPPRSPCILPLTRGSCGGPSSVGTVPLLSIRLYPPEREDVGGGMLRGENVEWYGGTDRQTRRQEE